jgi:HEAT repeat protein
LPGLLEAFLLSAVVVCGAAEAGDRDALTAKLQSTDVEEQSVIDQLKKSPDDQDVHALMKIVEERRDDWKLQILAIRLLGEIADPVATELLIKVVTDHFFTNECPALKWNGIIALGNFKGDSRVVDALLYRLNEDTLYLREAVIQSLGKIGNRETLPYVISGLGDKHFAIRMSALRALGEMEDPGAILPLKKVADTDADPLIRREALKVLEGLTVR